MNLGQLFGGAFRMGSLKITCKSRSYQFLKKISEDRIIESLKIAGLPENGKTVLYDARTGEKI